MGTTGHKRTKPKWAQRATKERNESEHNGAQKKETIMGTTGHKKGGESRHNGARKKETKVDTTGHKSGSHGGLSLLNFVFTYS